MGTLTINNASCGSAVTTTTTTADVFTPIKYGALYNWWAIIDERNITSSNDWIVPSVNDFITLLDYIDTYDTVENWALIAGGKLKETGLTYWNTPNTGATNEVGFNGRGGGYREFFGDFTAINNIGVFATNIEAFGVAYWNYLIEFVSTVCGQANSQKNTGHSIRLLYTGSGTPTSYIGNDGRIYPIILIGTQYWLSRNLNETKYRNGDWITGFDSGIYTPISNVAWAALTTEAMCYYNDDINNG